MKKRFHHLQNHSKYQHQVYYSSSPKEIDEIYQDILQKNKEQKEKDKVLTKNKLKKQRKWPPLLPKKTVNDIEADELDVIDDAQEMEEPENTEE